jgi:2,3-bisphosphoglycerate-dependent phosphoglycerate mutase
MVNFIYVFRHGQSTYNRDGRFTGWKDAKLTKKGKDNAKTIAKKLKNKKIDVAVHTKLSRSKETLKIVLKSHPECKKILEDNRMIERSYGKISGKTHEAIIKKYGKEQFEKWHRGFNERPPKGESFADVEKRVKNFVRWLKIYVKKNKVNIAISAHGNSIRLFRKIIESLSIKKTCEINIPYDKVFVYKF